MNTNKILLNRDGLELFELETVKLEAVQLETPISEDSCDELAFFETFLQSKLSHCRIPSAHELGEYALGLLSPEKAAVVELYLNDFPHRHYELNQLHAYLKVLEPELPVEPAVAQTDKPSLSQRFKWTLAQLVPDTRNMGMAYRSQGDDAQPRLYATEEMHISLDILNDSERTDRCSLLGLMIGPDVEGYTAHLWRTEPREKVDFTEITDAGNFMISGIEPDQYELILEGPALDMVMVEGLSVGL